MKRTEQIKRCFQGALRSALLPAALMATLLSVSACGGGSQAGAPTPPATPVALEASPPGALRGYVQQKLSEQVDQGQALAHAYGKVSVVADVNMTGGAFTTTSSSGGASTATAFSSTTLQEVGVDEPDLMKTDGQRIFSLLSDEPYSYRLNKLRVDRRLDDGSLQAEGSLTLGESAPQAGASPVLGGVEYGGEEYITGLHLSANGEQVALLGQKYPRYTYSSATAPTPVTGTNGVVVTADIGLSDYSVIYTPVAPEQAVIDLVSTSPPMAKSRSVRIDGNLVESRMIGNILYLVTTWYPQLTTITTAMDTATTAERKAAIAGLTNKDLLPTITITSANAKDAAVTQPLMADTDCYLQSQNASYGVQMTTITALNLASPTLERASRCFLGGTEALYMSAKNVYLATSRYTTQGSDGIVAYSSQTHTDIHKFAIDGMSINYRGSGEVSGHLGWDRSKNAYRMSEYQNDLRVLTYTAQWGWFGELDASKTDGQPSPAILTVLREDASGTQLTTVSTLPNAKRPAPIGLSGEQVYAVRFLGERAYVVTFRRTDPLYILDLADPSDPKVSGELKTNGYSDYLLPVTNDLLLGVGKDADDTGRVQGVKLSLFDVTDAANPKEVATRTIGKTGSSSGLDYGSHGINIFTTGGVSRVALPVAVNETLYEAPNLFFGGTMSWYDPSYRGLARFDIDIANKTLTERPTLVGQTFTPGQYGYDSWLGFERSVQLDAHVYYLTGLGKVMGSAW